MAVSDGAVLRVMVAKASTPAHGWTTPVPRIAGAATPAMIRITLIVVAVGVLLFGGALLLLGVFPPDPKPQAVEKVIPNDKFQSR